ncbi:MAG: hypothetical protein O3B03_05050, partial [Proteobacteria bacterium]|nr:hypothetical protein [Pseudomonadota bacterium]
MITLKLHYTKLQLLIICWVPFFISGELAQAQAEDAELPVINGIHVTKESQPINLGVALAETTVEAARITGVRDQYIEAEGNAVIIRGDQEFRGNYLLYDQIYDEITGREDVSIKKPKVFILGDTLKYSPSTEKGEITGARYFFTETDAR